MCFRVGVCDHGLFGCHTMHVALIDFVLNLTYCGVHVLVMGVWTWGGHLCLLDIK